MEKAAIVIPSGISTGGVVGITLGVILVVCVIAGKNIGIYLYLDYFSFSPSLNLSLEVMTWQALFLPPPMAA